MSRENSKDIEGKKNYEKLQTETNQVDQEAEELRRPTFSLQPSSSAPAFLPELHSATGTITTTEQETGQNMTLYCQWGQNELYFIDGLEARRCWDEFVKAYLSFLFAMWQVSCVMSVNNSVNHQARYLPKNQVYEMYEIYQMYGIDEHDLEDMDEDYDTDDMDYMDELDELDELDDMDFDGKRKCMD